MMGNPMQRPAPPQQGLPEGGDDMEEGYDEETDFADNEEIPIDQMAPQAQMPQLNGEDVQMLLISRFGQLSPAEQDQFADLVTPETIPVLFKMFPELGILFDKVMELRGTMQGEGGQGMEEPYAGQPMQQGADYEQEDEPQNPLVNDNLSYGLMR